MLRRPLAAVLPRLISSSRPIYRSLASTARPRCTFTPVITISVLRSFSTSSPTRATCSQCSAPLPSPLPVCTKCFHISQIPPEMSYHEMFGAPYEPNPFVVNNVEIKRRFRDLQTIVHPDRWVGKSPEQQEAAAVMSAKINEALHRLSNPLRRVEYILDREGHSREDADRLEDSMLLMEIMELREEIEGSESREEVERVRAENAEKLEETIDEIERLVGQKDWLAVKSAAVKLKYLQGIENAAEAWPRAFSDQ